MGFQYVGVLIEGNVAMKVDGREECAICASVALLNDAGDKIGEGITDTLGHFQLDNLEAQSGKYIILINLKGFNPKSIEVDLEANVNLGLIYL
ncbi:MAG: carboxypeptidase-like regulatory domain-containing protein [Dehalococcoidia bacterium]|jgi:hypothetical protein